MLRKAQGFLYAAAFVSKQGLHQGLASTFAALDDTDDSRALGLNFETYFASQLLINLVSEVEHFMASAIGAALQYHPEKMGKTTFTLAEVMAAESPKELVKHAAASMLNAIMYEKPKDYLKRFAEIVSIDDRALEKRWPRFVELKARRDLGVHNNWMVNEIYLRKLREVDLNTDVKVGDRIVPDFAYLTDSSAFCDDLVAKLADLLGQKWIPGPTEATTLNARMSLATQPPAEG